MLCIDPLGLAGVASGLHQIRATTGRARVHRNLAAPCAVDDDALTASQPPMRERLVDDGLQRNPCRRASARPR